MLKNLSIKKLLIYVAIIIVTLCLVNIFTIYSQTNKLEHSSHKQRIEVLPKTFAYLELQTNVIQVQQWLTDISATRAAEGFDDGFEEAQKYYSQGNKILNKLIEDNKQKGNTAKVKELEAFKLSFSKFYFVGKKMANTYIKYGETAGNQMMSKLDPFAVELTNTLEIWVNAHKKEITTLGDNIDEGAMDIKEVTLTFGLILISFLVIIFIVLIRQINQSLSCFQRGLIYFFKFLNKETSTIEPLDDKANTEIGKMSRVINDNINKTKESIEKDHQFIEEVKNIVETVKAGSLENRLNNKSSNQSLEELRTNFNDMLETLQNDVGRNTKSILEILDRLAVYDFTKKIDNAQGKISVALNSVIDLITQMLIENKANGLTLDKSSNMLLENVDKLNKSSTETAASLEETAAALEEITGTIRLNTENVTKMSEYAYNLTQSAKKGEDLANTTTSAMEDINQQVSAINDAITVIDQIAFQTNILSLNAAVEAATAGEAGKGFAVVAQEVRNLATRSAEAAKEIKDLVDNANLKANQGKNIAEEMIAGYTDLNENISSTLVLIKDIDSASKEQLSGIEQINDAVTSLDQQTQENVSVSNHTHNIAEQTDEIAKLVVSNADAKQFIGKESVKAKNFEEREDFHISQKSYSNNSHQKQKVTTTNNHEQHEHDQWESF